MYEVLTFIIQRTLKKSLSPRVGPMTLTLTRSNGAVGQCGPPNERSSCSPESLFLPDSPKAFVIPSFHTLTIPLRKGLMV